MSPESGGASYAQRSSSGVRSTTGEVELRKSTTGDVSDVEHADSNQRQLVADYGSCCFGHAVDFSRAPAPRSNREN